MAPPAGAARSSLAGGHAPDLVGDAVRRWGNRGARNAADDAGVPCGRGAAEIEQPGHQEQHGAEERVDNILPMLQQF